MMGRKITLLNKRRIHITGTLASRLALGHPAVYLYHGELIRTSAVRAILKATPDYVRFATSDIVYTISQDTLPGAGANQIA